MADRRADTGALTGRPATTRPDEGTTLAIERTLLAQERTLMAWVRTSTALISFGFTIYKFFAYLQETEKVPIAQPFFGPREFAIVMICGGLGTLLLSAIDFRRSRRRLSQVAGHDLGRSLALVVAVGLALIGISGLVVAILRQ